MTRPGLLHGAAAVAALLLLLLIPASAARATQSYQPYENEFYQSDAGVTVATVFLGSFTEVCPIDITTKQPDCGLLTPQVDSINWGDGTGYSNPALQATCGTHTCSFSAYDACPYLTDVHCHVYAEEGTYAVSFIWEDPSNGTPQTMVSTTLTVRDDPLASAPATAIQATEGRTFSGQLAGFGQLFRGWLDLSLGFADYTATVNWGDGTTSGGAISSNWASYGTSGYAFIVSGSHAYAHSGTWPVTVSISDDGGASTTATLSATVQDASLSAAGVAPVATEGAAFSGTVATFADGNQFATAGDFTATIDWGDGSRAASGTVTAAAGGFQVSGGHTYARSGSHAVKVTITDTGGSGSTATTTATVADAPLTGTGVAPSSTEGAQFSGMVATFTDHNPTASAGDFTATIDWGDGNSGTGVVTAKAGGGFQVTASHTFTRFGAYPVKVTINDTGGASTTATSTATVADVPLTGIGVAPSSTEGARFSGTVATFTDHNPAASAGDFTARIDWGDGGISAGAVSPRPAGGFQVSGDHTYREGGAPVVSVTVTDPGGSTLSVTSRAAVADPPLSGSGVVRQPTVGVPLSGVLARFTDADQTAAASEFTARIEWGDGTASDGVVTELSGGGFAVSGTHVYHQEQTADILIRVADAGGARTILTSTAYVNAPGGRLFAGLSVRGSQSGQAVAGSVTLVKPNSTVTVVLSVPAQEAAAARHPAIIGLLIKRNVNAGKFSFRVRLNHRGTAALQRHHRLAVLMTLTISARGKSIRASRYVTLHH